MKHGISEILKKVSECETEAEKITLLRQHDNAALKTILQYAFDPRIVWLLPKGKAPFKPCEQPDVEGRLYQEIRRLYLFIQKTENGVTTVGNANLKQTQRETLYIQLLESISPADADLLVAAKDKKLPYKRITPKLINKAFPGLISDEQE
jgi:hypothetical protein